MHKLVWLSDTKLLMPIKL